MATPLLPDRLSTTDISQASLIHRRHGDQDRCPWRWRRHWCGGHGAKSLSDLVLGFFEDGEAGWSKRPDLFGSSYDDEEEEPGESAAERRAFWESQLLALKGLVSPTNSVEARLQRTVESAVSSLRTDSFMTCSCSGSNSPNTLPCRPCTLRHISDSLRCAGYDAAVCLSRWRATPSSTAGDHSYLEVAFGPSATNPSGKTPRRIIVEPAFRAEFEMARACPEYSSLVELLPQVFVGRAERLSSLLKVVCGQRRSASVTKGCMWRRGGSNDTWLQSGSPHRSRESWMESPR